MSRFELALYPGSIVHAPGEMVLIPVPQEERPLGGNAGRLDWRLRGEISRKMVSGFVTAGFGEAALIGSRPPIGKRRLLLLGMGPADERGEYGPELLTRLARTSVERLAALHCRSVLLALPGALDLDACAEVLLTGFVRSAARLEADLRLILPDASGRESRLEAIVLKLLPEANQAGLELEVGWIGSQGTQSQGRQGTPAAPATPDPEAPSRISP